jgi:hypothetical protein
MKHPDCEKRVAGRALFLLKITANYARLLQPLNTLVFYIAGELYPAKPKIQQPASAHSALDGQPHYLAIPQQTRQRRLV